MEMRPTTTKLCLWQELEEDRQWAWWDDLGTTPFPHVGLSFPEIGRGHSDDISSAYPEEKVLLTQAGFGLPTY
jgi:hypothetical protein